MPKAEYIAGRARGLLTGGRGGAGTSQTPGDKAYTEDAAKQAAARYDGIQKAGDAAPTNIARYRQLGDLLAGVDGNRFSPTGVEVAQIANRAGLNIDPKLPNKEAAAAITNQLALQLRDPSQGGGMPGALSDSDRNFLLSSVPRLGQSAEGRKMMVESAVRLNQRNADVAGMARQWVQRFGRIDTPDRNGKTFQDHLQAWSTAHPLFGTSR
jgi:hypothetical protein